MRDEEEGRGGRRRGGRRGRGGSGGADGGYAYDEQALRGFVDAADERGIGPRRGVEGGALERVVRRPRAAPLPLCCPALTPGAQIPSWGQAARQGTQVNLA